VLTPFKIDFAVFLLVTAADMPRRETAKMIAAAGLLFRLKQTLRRLPLRDFVKSRKRLKTLRRRKWTITF